MPSKETAGETAADTVADETTEPERTEWPIDFDTLETMMDDEFVMLYNLFTNSEWTEWKLEDGTPDWQAIVRLRELLASQVAQWHGNFEGPFNSTVWKGNADGSLPKDTVLPLRQENTGNVGRKPKPKPETPAEIRARYKK